MAEPLLSELMSAVERTPQDALARLRLAEVLLEAGRASEALPHIGAVVVDAPASLRVTAVLRAHPDFPKWVQMAAVRGGSNAVARQILGFPPTEPIKVRVDGKQVYTKDGARIEALGKFFRRAVKAEGHHSVRLTVTISGTDVVTKSAVVPLGHDLYEPIVRFLEGTA